MRLFLGMIAVLAVVAGLTAFIALRFDELDDQASNQVVGGTVGPGTGEATTTTGEPAPAPGAGQVSVEGTITELHLEGARLDPSSVPTPLTIVSDRGMGNGAELHGVTVEGADSSIIWDGGRPFVLSSGGAMVLDPVNADLSPEGIRLALSTSVQGFAPGTYRLDTPVAVGVAGVASARDGVTFAATDASTFEAKGDAALFLDGSTARRLTGPGTVHLAGALTVTEADGTTRTVATADLAEGPFDLTFTAAPGGGWQVRGLLQGAVTAT